MNLGIYVQSVGDQEQMKYVAECINVGLDNKQLRDASIFYNDVGFNPHLIKCGMFNSTDVWNFSGTLVSTSLPGLISAKNIVNDIDLFYYYGWEGKVNVLEVMAAISSHNFHVICNSERDAAEWNRITGQDPLFICDKFHNLITLLEVHNGRK